MSTTPRPRRTQLTAATVTIALAVLLALTGCSSDDSDNSGSGDSAGGKKTADRQSRDTASDGDSDLAPAGEPLATIQGDEDMIARIMKVKREDGFFIVTAILENTGDDDFLTVGWKDEPGRKPYTLAGSKFVDTKNKTRHWPIYEADTESCECTSGDAINKIEAGEKVEAYVSFPDVLTDVKTVRLSLATFPPTDIPVPAEGA
ncbi:hypothetical protein OG705_29975 [Streptomyces sp. NBC_00838]|uniref:hypothetical protein n=1 Tax=Streptomyces sp. NBC_00838 TaxID=2903680 RepID=UPI0038672A25|nr:hypothetical protein OG705_29975 [Streptomyces sp. NBC_00838]